MDQSDLRVHLVLLDQKELLGTLVALGHLVLLERKGQLVQLDQLVPVEVLGLQVRMELLEILVLKVIVDQLGLRDLKDQ